MIEGGGASVARSHVRVAQRLRMSKRPAVKSFISLEIQSCWLTARGWRCVVGELSSLGGELKQELDHTLEDNQQVEGSGI